MAKKKIQYQDKVKNNGTSANGIFTNDDANEIKQVVNNNADLLHDHRNKNVIDTIGFDDLDNWNATSTKAHTHTNKNILDVINQNLHTGASPTFLNVNVNDSVNANNINATTEVNTPILNANAVNTDYVNADAEINTPILNATTEVNTKLLNADAVRTNDISSENFVSGFGGSGYRLNKDSNDNFNLEIDNLTVRKEMSVYQLTINEIKATNGSIWVSDGIEAFQVETNGNNYVCKIDTADASIAVPFRVNDIVRCQKFNGKDVKYYTALVTATDNDSFTLEKIEGGGIPASGDKIVRIGNTTDNNRKGALYLTSSDSGSPYLDVIDGVDTASFAGKTKVRLGKLDGIVDADLGTLSGYGIYAQNGFFKGKFIVQNGSNVYNKNEANTVINTAKNDAITISNNNINNALTALNIGGRNLVLNSSFLLGTQPWGFDANVEYTDNQGYLTIKLNGANYPNAGLYQFIKGIESHSDYFLSVEIQKITNNASSIRIGLESVDFRTIELKNDLNWNKYTFVFNSGSFSDLQPLAIKPTSGNVAEFRLKNIYLTKGNKANDWTPAPEDFQVQIDATLNASKAYSDAQDELKKIEANAYADGKVTAEEQRAIQDATNKANAAKAYADAQDVLLKAQSDAYVDGKITAEEQARINQAQANLQSAKEYADAQDNLSKIEAKAYADGVVDAEEQRAIDDAKAKLVEAKQHAEQQASQAQANAIATASQDATNKANQAKNDAIASSNQFAQNAINALNIGGRNYYSNNSTVLSVYESIIEERHTGNVPNGFKLAGNQYGTTNVRLEKVINGNGWWTVSGYARGDQSVEGGFDIDICDGESKRFYFTADNNWTYFEYSYYVNNYDNVYNFIDFGRLSWLYFYFKNIKVEKGNKATDWSPAPEDVDDAITVFKTETATKFQVLETQISSKVSQNDFNSLGQRVSSAESSIIQNANEILSKVSKTEFTELNNTVAGINGRVSNTESAITQQSNLIATKVTQTDVDVSIGQIRVGGRNLIKGTSNQLIKVDTSSWGITELGSILVNVGDEITVSVFVKDFSKPIMLELWGLDDNNSRLDTNVRSTDVVNNILQATIKFNVVGVVRLSANLAFTSPQSSSETYTYSKVKFERGNKATDWTPAPEDVDDAINNLDSRVVTNTTAITQKADTIALNATRLDLINYTNNELQPVKDRISSAELKITPDAINSTVSGQIDNKISDVVVIKDTREFNNPPSWYYDNYPRRTVQEFKRVTVLGLPNVGEDYAKLTTNVPWLDFSGGNVVQEAIQAGRTYTRYGGGDSWTAWIERESTNGAQDKANSAYNSAVTYANSQITQTKDAIQLSVDQKISNIQIGGRNLVINSKGERSVVNSSTNTNNENYLPFYYISVELDKETEYTFSCEMWMTSNVSSADMFYVNNYGEHRANTNIKLALNAWYRQYFTFKTGVEPQLGFLRFDNNSSTDGQPATLKVRNVKLEKGNKVTDWTPAPEDVQGQIDDVVTRVSSAELKITSDAINSTVKTQTESIVNTAVSKIEVGGRNLILGTSTAIDFSNPTTEYTLKTYSFNKPLENGQDYCISFKIKTFAGKTSRIWYRTNQDRIGSFEATINFNEENQNQVKTYVAFFKANNSDNNIVFYNYGYASTEAQRLGNSGIIYDLKIEKGNKATDWSPAPEDVNTRLIQAETSISQNANAISLKATQGDIDNSIKNINIGGRNYYSNNSTVLSVYESIIEERHTGNVPNGFKLAGNQYGTTNVRLEKVINGNGWWTVSGYARGDQSVEGGFDIDICDGESKRFYFTADNNWTYFEYSYYVNNYDNVYNFIDFGRLSWLYFYFKNIKVEKGNKATDWSPAPEDIDTRISQAELKITPEAIKSTVKGQTEDIVNTAVPKTKFSITTIGLDENKFYPVVIGLQIDNRYKIIIDRPLLSDYGMPSYGQHSTAGFSARVEWTSIGSGWGARNIERDISICQQAFVNGLPFGSLGQVTETSQEIIYLRGGSIWLVTIEGTTDGYADVKSTGYTWGSGTYGGTVPVLDNVEAIKSTNNRITSAETSIIQTKDEINLRATKTEVTTQVNQAKTDASNDATSKANNAISTSKTYTDNQISITNNAISLKADKSVVEGLTSRINSAELKITPDAINTTVKGQIDGAINIVFQEVAEIKDTRNFNNPPSWYYENYPFRTVREFKNIGVVGLPDLGEYYAQVTTFVPWGDLSGGYVVQEAVQLGRTYTRFGSTDSWSAWVEKETTIGSQNKANDAYNNAVGYTNTKITQTKDEINLSVTTKIDNVKLGGRNYYKKDTVLTPLAGAHTVVKTDTGFSVVGVIANNATLRISNVITENGYWTISFEHRFSISGYPISIDICDSDQVVFPAQTSTDWQKYVATVYVNNYSSQYNFIDINNLTGQEHYFRNVKIEKGNKATDWSPAPEDVQNQIDSVANRVSSAELKLTDDAIRAVVKTQTQNIVNDTVLANLWSSGKPLNPDPTFKEGFNGLQVYNNTGAGATVWGRLAKSSFNEVFPTTSGYGLYYMQGGDRPTSPGWGGFYFETQTRAKAKFIVRMLLAFETGRNISFNSNSYGDNAIERWLTPTEGKGINNFTEYIHYLECGATGSFSTTNFFSFSGGGSVSVRIAFAGVYDITDAVNNYTTKEEIASSFTMTPGGISLAGKNISLAGMVTFSSLDAGTQGYIYSIDNKANGLQTSVNNWAYPSSTEINGAKIRTGSINASKIIVDSLELRQLKTGAGQTNVGVSTIGIQPSDINDPTSNNKFNKDGMRQYHPSGRVSMYMGIVSNYSFPYGSASRTVNGWAIITFKDEAGSPVFFVLDSLNNGGIAYAGVDPLTFTQVSNYRHVTSTLGSSATASQLEGFISQANGLCGAYQWATYRTSIGIAASTSGQVWRRSEYGQPIKYVTSNNSTSVISDGWYYLNIGTLSGTMTSADNLKTIFDLSYELEYIQNGVSVAVRTINKTGIQWSSSYPNSNQSNSCPLNTHQIIMEM
ncbi:cell envelope integrity protein TolA [Sphingobacterium multivorum]|uniref:cell envelope integrity protein TolA n=1 Tax=Sphingobacterium multivorum TaxID=28454 RepID=UPI0028A6941B|nr:hypothetical protein [Sphingobacterium multivorum]